MVFHYFAGLYMDAEAALQFVLNRKDLDHSRIVIYGRSLGGAVALALASHEDFSNSIFALIVENTFTSIPDMAKHLFSWIRKLPRVFYRNQVGISHSFRF